MAISTRFDLINDNNYRYRVNQSPAPIAELEVPVDRLGGQRILSEALFSGRREVVIVHNGREYRLRLTQNDKLILTA